MRPAVRCRYADLAVKDGLSFAGMRRGLKPLDRGGGNEAAATEYGWPSIRLNILRADLEGRFGYCHGVVRRRVM